jgi:hypothetical protein
VQREGVPFEELRLKKPYSQGPNVRHAQESLNHNRFGDFLGGNIDGVYGPDTAKAVETAKFKLGYMKRRIDRHYDEKLDAYLNNRHDISAWMKKRRKDRTKSDNVKCPDLYMTLGCPPERRLHLERGAFGTHIAILQCAALESLKEVWAECQTHDASFVIASTYRSCDTQREVCAHLCGNPNGCPGTCAPPGRSYHQLGLAVDAPATKNPSEVRRIFYAHGWHNFSSHDGLTASGSDPWHFSFRATG